MTSVRHDYSVILRTKNTTHEILIVDGSLPFTENPMHFWQSTEIVNQAIYEKYRLQVTTIRCLEPMITNGEGQPLLNVYLQLYIAGEIADNMRWVAIGSPIDLQLPPVIDNLQNWISWLSFEHPQRKSWYHVEGVRETFKAVQTEFDVQPQQIRTWERSAVWRIPVEKSNLYLKDIPPMFAFEAPLTKWLYKCFPEHSTPTLDWDNPDQLLMADYGGASLASHMDVEIYEHVLSTYAELQIDLVKETETIKNIGVPYRPVGWIAESLEAFLLDDANLTRGEFPLTEGQIATIQHAIPRLKQACDALSKSPIPEALEHGDFLIGQIIICDEKPIFTDWSDSAITFPWFSLPYIIAEKGDLPETSDAKNRLTNAYLDRWTCFANWEIIDQLIPHVNLLSPLYSALRYHHDILPQMEVQWEMENMVGYNLRLLLKSLEG